MRALVLGAAGLLGNAVFRVFCERSDWHVGGTVRTNAARQYFAPELAGRLVLVGDLTRYEELERLFSSFEPVVVVNCLAPPRKSFDNLGDMLEALALFPQRLSHLCRLRGVRLLHVSSDGVFSGSRGAYSEDDCPDATDAYGIAKYLGEPAGVHAVTLRTSMLGPELGTRQGLLEWFLAQRGRCRGFTRAIFSGLPTVVLAEIFRDVVVARPELHGVYHLAAAPISKFRLLELVAAEYGKEIELTPDEGVGIDRSLIPVRFMAATGYTPPDWPELVHRMHAHRFGLVRS